MQSEGKQVRQGGRCDVQAGRSYENEGVSGRAVSGGVKARQVRVGR